MAGHGGGAAGLEKMGTVTTALYSGKKNCLSLEEESSALCLYFTKTLYNRVLVYEATDFYIKDLEEK